jgi:hypothetical protein
VNDNLCRLVADHLNTQASREERATLAQRLIAVLGALCLVLLVCIAVTWPTNAHAQDIPLHVLDKDGVQIRLMDSPCVDARSIMMIRPDALPRFKAVQSVWPERDGSRKEYAGCWAALTAQESGSEEGFLVIFSDGESGFVPKSEFKKVRGQVGA